MKFIFFGIIAFCLLVCEAPAQTQVPPGESKFIRSMMDFGVSKLSESIAEDNFDQIEGGGGALDWTILDNRVFLTGRWMEEVGTIKEGYSVFDYERELATAFVKRLEAEGFQVKNKSDRLFSISYQRGTTVGLIEVRTHFDEKSNYRMDFIFYESYLQQKAKRAAGRTVVTTSPAATSITVVEPGFVKRNISPRPTRPATPNTHTRTYYTGPKGGCYYLSPSGAKVYVNHSYCK